MSTISATVTYIVWLLLTICLLLFFFLPKVLAADQGVQDPVHITFAGVEPSIEIFLSEEQVPRVHHEKSEPYASNGQDIYRGLGQDRRAVFDFSTPDAGGLFAGSRWILLPDRFGFLPSRAFLNAKVSASSSGHVASIPQVRAHTFSLIGRLGPAEPGRQTLELHGAHEGPTGSLFTLDGFVRRESGRRVLDAVYSIGLRGSEQVGRVRLCLEPKATDQASPKTADQDVAPLALGLEQTDASAPTPEALNRGRAAHWARQERTLWENGNDTFFRFLVESHQFMDQSLHVDPVLFTVDKPDYIKGIPVMSQFDVKLEGTVDGIEFGPVPALLMLSKSEQPGQAISVLLSAEGFPDGPPGTIAGSTAMGSGWEVRAEEAALNFALRLPPTATGSLCWTTMLNGEPSTAYPSRADGTLFFLDDRVEGSLEVEGYLALDAVQGSRYSAQITGTLHKDEAFEKVLKSVGVLPLIGEWQTGSPALDVIRLKQAGDSRRGTFGPDDTGQIDGQIADGLLTLTWTGPEGNRGWGFLRPLSGADRAIGLWGAAQNRSDAMSVLASQPRKPWDTQVGTALSGEKVELLHNLGRDLASQGKCTQALSVLDLVWKSYDNILKELKNSTERSETKIFSVLVQMYTISQPMLDCAFDLGRFATTLDYLRKAVWLQAEMNPLARARNAFTYRVDKAGAELRDGVDNFAQLLANLDILRSPKVGLQLNPRPAGRPLKVLAVASHGPAALAGLRAGDEIVSINGKPATPLDTKEALRALGGAEGTELKLVLSRSGEQQELSMVRGPWFYALTSAERRAQLEQAMESLRASAEETRFRLLALADAIEKDEPPSAPSGCDFDEAFQEVINRIEAETVRVPDRIQRLIALGESLFRRWDRYMPTQRFVLYTFAQMIGEAGQVPVAECPQTINAQQPIGVVEDEMIEALFTDPTLNGAEVGLFYEHFKATILTLSLRPLLSKISRDIERWKKFAKPTPEAMAEHARKVGQFSQWMERWRQRLVLDSGKISALEAGTCFAREWLNLLWELEPRSGDVSTGGAIEVLLAAESARNRAMQDLLTARKDPAFTRQGGALTSLKTQPPLTVEELVELVRSRGGTTIVYQSLDDGLLVWVLDAAKLSCTSETKPLIAEQVSGNSPINDELQRLNIDARAQLPQDHLTTRIYRCQGIEARKLPVSADDIKTFASRFQSFAARKVISQDDGSAQAFSGLLHELYQRLVAPIAQLLPVDPDAVVTVIPDAELFHIPFGALIQTPVKDGFAELRYLIEDHAIVYLTSIGMMRFTRDNARWAAETARSDFVTLLDPVGIEYSGLEPFFKDEEMRSTVEAYLTKYYPQGTTRTVFSGVEATRDNLFATSSRARVLTFITHAEANEAHDNHRGSYIALAGAALPLADVYGLDLHADLAILAGCETGRGRIGADGVIGLSRAFVFAGAPTLAMTLWEVTAGDTLVLLDRFYRAYLSEGKSKAQALRQAQIAAISDLTYTGVPQPNLWAGMVLFGEP